MQHPPTVWAEATYADESLRQLLEYYIEHLKGRSKPASPGTIDKYRKSLLSFIRSVERTGQAATVGALTPHAVNGWIAEQRRAKRAEEGIARRLGALKAFSRKYVFRQLELTTCDLLNKVVRITPPGPSRA